MSAPERPSRRDGLLTLLRANYAYTFLHQLTFAYAIMTAYFSFNGVNVATIGILIAVWSASTVVFELPSGALSDRFDRRVMLAIAPLFKAACFVVWVLADGSVFLYGLGFALWALSHSLISGTQQAVVFEHVHRARFGRWYEKVMGRERVFENVGGYAGVLFGGFIAYVDLDLAMWLSVPPLVAASFVAFWLKDARTSEPGAERKPRLAYMQNFVNAFREFRHRPRLRFLTLYMALGINLYWVFEEFDQLFYLEVGLPIWAFGLVGVATGVGRIVLLLQVDKFKSISSLGFAAPAAAGAMLLIAGLEPSLWMLISLAGFHLCIAPVEVLTTAGFQKAMDGESRATTTSGASVMVEIVSMLMFVGAGALMDALGILPAYQVGGLCLLFVAAWAFWRDRKGQVLNDSSRF